MRNANFLFGKKLCSLCENEGLFSEKHEKRQVIYSLVNLSQMFLCPTIRTMCLNKIIIHITLKIMKKMKKNNSKSDFEITIFHNYKGILYPKFSTFFLKTL